MFSNGIGFSDTTNYLLSGHRRVIQLLIHQSYQSKKGECTLLLVETGTNPDYGRIEIHCLQ